ncbi:OLC1v1012450C1 [Oldenlandia corymbosa var. corymbosa]|uniref:OLC1v1012450C1 n=1 Tax=Oldenlandia corymbosa var. corymbosa TaxID=529605 RepID=A0AAV1DYZ1_OLDCO|nr:OLC1v1012450C1 [Oldenlandia corymbosa var. corymbosa]
MALTKNIFSATNSFCFISLFLVSIQSVLAAKDQNDGIYIVYTGAAPSSSNGHHCDHIMSSSSIESWDWKDRVLHTYSKAFSGFAARLSKEEAESIARRPEVVSVFPDQIHRIHTTRSWDFLKEQSVVGLKTSQIPTSNISSVSGEDVIIGVFDTGATTIDRFFESDVVLGNNKVIKGGGVHSANFEKNPIYPLIDARLAKKPDGDEADASTCLMDALDGKKVKGKIVLCHPSEDYATSAQFDAITSLGGIAMIYIDEFSHQLVDSVRGSVPCIPVYPDSDQILAYINSTRNPVATILPTVAKANNKPAPAVAYFSAPGGTLDDNRYLIKGYNASRLKLISSKFPTNFSCPSDPKEESMSNMNYPSISVFPSFRQNRTVTRTVTNVGDEESVYRVSFEASEKLEIIVSPTELIFTKHQKKLSYTVTFTDAPPFKACDPHGSIIWSNDKHKVRIPFIVRC